ncbi:hypothetical protein BO86DRAFT_129107 [Aspergillus japonicus CBS 114.51]|uniref:EF-hand domain-containing protein n=2 Tax=Aspergillus TaxID=5052 RepID=A0A2V5H0F3_ASPV1|nr:hypothetical protein BO86DRAFT_129107 [Aspergillus japonicus CBS 114.51]PYI17379.1 hypothetical protein BO99DRAFT_194674 [Aspergillus violaceofuscus CBS 115571]RAH80407.1 hypothetical protein BO86DRAFT_129107 [Aspergillus japonicus CBS 114.51]
MSDKEEVKWDAYYSWGFLQALIEFFHASKEKKTGNFDIDQIAKYVFKGDKEDAKKFLKVCDANADGKVDFGEFLQALLDEDAKQNYKNALVLYYPSDTA